MIAQKNGPSDKEVVLNETFFLRNIYNSMLQSYLIVEGLKPKFVKKARKKRGTVPIETRNKNFLELIHAKY